MTNSKFHESNSLQSLHQSPFFDHIRTNTYIPSTVEKLHISHLLVAPQHELNALNSEIAGLEWDIEEVLAKKASLDEVIEQHQCLLAPFRRIPDDTLRSIFLYCLPADHDAIIMLTEAPLLLTQVCRRWRRVAFDTPALWCTLYIPRIPRLSVESPSGIHLAPDAQFRLEAHISAIAQWLKQAGTQPLSISIPKTAFAFTAYLAILLSFSRQWYRIRIHADDPTTSIALASLSPEDVPLLKELHITFSNWSGTAQSHKLWQKNGGILNAPNLKSLTLHYFPINIATMAPNWKNLTRLVLCDPSTFSRKSSPAEVYMILRTCTSLVHLTFAVYDAPPVTLLPIGQGHPLPFSLANLRLPFLESLSFNDHYYYMPALLWYLQAPSLRRIAFSTLFHPSSQRLSPLVALCTMNGTTLRHLTFDPRTLTYTDLRACCALSPNLESVEFQPSRISPTQEQASGRIGPMMVNIMGPIFQLLTPSLDGQCYWPRLQSLSSGVPVLDEYAALRFVRSRIEAISTNSFQTHSILPLKHLSIILGFGEHIDLAARLDEYVKNGGLKLDIVDHWKPRPTVDDAVLVPGIFRAREGIAESTFWPPPF
ncbi:hypothetical protein BDN70DRAFT_881539 [Pholiota conissans]|uniref:F-box domain-containing protein n=1 Tax=Pholiota conissans TaxID=109636 RepID=A0A9P5YWT0_9AGAR|nr:hypothetical protein BDN70DRAFT_881539 [Pholiota conissans]